tara:strand:- start:4175 stop:4465 length:291 start_codon:yes stop_codon:yes gene_type:complete
MSITGYHGTYTKANGDTREMYFVRLQDVPEAFLTSRIKGGSKPRTLKEGMETVWDVKANDFRIFNWNTTQGDPKQINFEENEIFVLTTQNTSATID